MSKINFLKTKESSEENDDTDNQGANNRQRQNIDWSNPKETDSKKEDAKKASFLGLFKKEKKAAIEGGGLKNIKLSRKKVLRAIKEESKQNLLNKKDKPARRNEMKNFFRNFFRKTNFKNSLFNYQKFFHKEKEQRKIYKKLNEVKNDIGDSKEAPKVTESRGEAVKAVDIKEIAKEKILLPEQKDILNRVDDSQTAGKKEEKKIEKQPEAEWYNPDVLDSNLIKGEVISFFDWKKKIVVLVGSIVTSCLLIAVVYGGLFYYEKMQEAEGEAVYNKILDLDKKIEQKKEGLEEILSFQKRLKLVSSLLDEHVYWNNFFGFLEKHIIESVYFVNFIGDTKGVYGIEAIGQEYKNIVEQVEAFRTDKLTEKAEVKEGQIAKGKTSDGVKFNLELTVNSDIFKKTD